MHSSDPINIRLGIRGTEHRIMDEVTEIRDVTQRRIRFVKTVMISVLSEVEEISWDLIEELNFQTPFIKHWQGV